MRAPGRRDFVTISLGSLVSMTIGPGRAVAAAQEGPPALLNATWDWGAGDFETALGAASHMGNRESAGVLLARGARLDLILRRDDGDARCRATGRRCLPGSHRLVGSARYSVAAARRGGGVGRGR